MPSFSERPYFFQQFTTNTFLCGYVQNFICKIQSINLHIYINAHFFFVETITNITIYFSSVSHDYSHSSWKRTERI